MLHDQHTATLQSNNGLHGGGAGKVERVGTTTGSLERDGVDEPVPGLGIGGQIGAGDIGIGHDDSVDLVSQEAGLNSAVVT